MKISYVILHYQNILVTMKSVECIANIKDSSSKIIVVDNASPNKTGNLLKEKFCNKNDVIVIENKKNYGFAIGNNIGYEYAKNILDSELIVILNSDVYIFDKDFEDKIRKLSNTKYDIIAPKIITLNGENQNPLRLKPLNLFRILKIIIFYSIQILALHIGIFNNLKAGKAKNSEGMHYQDNEIENVIPHGACIIFTSSYISNNNFAFLPITFLFAEEDILYEYAKRNTLKILYTPKIEVFHDEDSSVNYDYKSDRKKILFNKKHRLKSLVKLALYKSRLISHKKNTYNLDRDK